MLVATATLLLAVLVGAAEQRGVWDRRQSFLDTGRWVDLTHPLSPQTPHYPIYQPFTINANKSFAGTFGDVFVSYNFIEMFEHTGTHIDAPYHFAEEGLTEDQLTWGELTGPVSVVDISRKSITEGGAAQLTVEDLEEFVAANGNFPEKTFILVNSGWVRHYWDSAKYLFKENSTTELQFPCVSPAAWEWIWENVTDILGLGMDTISPDCDGPDNAWPVHLGLLKRNRIIIENVASMAGLPAHGAHLMIFPLHQVGGTGGPARVVAVLPGNPAAGHVPALLLIASLLAFIHA